MTTNHSQRNMHGRSTDAVVVPEDSMSDAENYLTPEARARVGIDRMLVPFLYKSTIKEFPG